MFALGHGRGKQGEGEKDSQTFNGEHGKEALYTPASEAGYAILV